MKRAFLWPLLASLISFQATAEEATVALNEYSAFGNIVVFDELPNVAWLFGEIQPDDYFHFRRIARRNSIEVVALASPGGSVYEALQIGAMVHDRNISTYIPSDAICASACSYIFLAGNSRLISGGLGVHQFYGDGSPAALSETQFTVSEIVGFLNEFDTPPMVFEFMFQDTEMYYFSEAEVDLIERVSAFDEEKIIDSGLLTRIDELFLDMLELQDEEYVDETAGQSAIQEPEVQADPEPEPDNDLAPDTIIPPSVFNDRYEISISCQRTDNNFHEYVGAGQITLATHGRSMRSNFSFTNSAGQVVAGYMRKPSVPQLQVDYNNGFLGVISVEGAQRFAINGTRTEQSGRVSRYAGSFSLGPQNACEFSITPTSAFIVSEQIDFTKSYTAAILCLNTSPIEMNGLLEESAQAGYLRMAFEGADASLNGYLQFDNAGLRDGHAFIQAPDVRRHRVDLVPVYVEELPDFDGFVVSPTTGRFANCNIPIFPER